MYEILQILGDGFGIEHEYTDNWGRVYHTDPRTAIKILESKGIHIDSNRLVMKPEVLVIPQNELPGNGFLFFDVKLDGKDPASFEGTIRVTEADGRAPERVYALPSDAVSLTADRNTGLLRLAVPLPSGLEPGSYRFLVKALIDEKTLESELKCYICPQRAYLPMELQGDGRLAGVSVALYGVRSESNWGVGDFGDLRKLLDWAAEDLGVDFVGLNPLHALFNKRPFNSSPYNPSSRFFRNFIYLDVPSIPEFASCAKAKELLNTTEIRNHIKKLRAEEHVNYEEVSALKLKFLKEIFLTFMENQSKSYLGNARWTAFQAYLESEGIFLERFATFCALREHFEAIAPAAATWREWPEAYHDPDSHEVGEFRSLNQEAILFWMFLQWQLDEQLREVQEHAGKLGMAIGLYNDEALAVDCNGADFWAWRRYFHDGFRVGAPPDAFAPEGQDWGFPPPNRDGIRDAAYEPFLKKLSTSCRHCGALRIDHVMQLHHLFWIPADGKAKDGVYVKDYEADLLNLVALESAKSNTVIIGEDLGTVPFDFRDRLMAKGVFSYRLFYFERDAKQDLVPYWSYPEYALVSISTHDLPTLAGFWSEADVEVRRGIGQLDEDSEQAFRADRSQHKAKIVERLVNDGILPPEVAHAAWESPLPTEELHSAVLSFLFRTPSKLVVINQEDVFLDVRQQNFPGTTWQNPNWVTKMRFTVEELRTNPEAVRLSLKFRSLLEQSGRSRARN